MEEWELVDALFALLVLSVITTVVVVYHVLLLAMTLAAVSELASETARGHYTLDAVVVASIMISSVILKFSRDWPKVEIKPAERSGKASVDISEVMQMLLVGSIFALQFFGLRVPEKFASIFAGVFPAWFGVGVLYIILKIAILHAIANK